MQEATTLIGNLRSESPSLQRIQAPIDSYPVFEAKMSGQSSVGTAAVYEAGDQRNLKDSEIPKADRYNEGVKNSHVPNDSSLCLV